MIICPKVLLEEAPKSAERISVDKKHGDHSLSQEKIQELLLQNAHEGKCVIRLKGGDPYIFGRGGEDILYLKEHGIETEVVPGISSAIALPALAGIPLTQRHLAMTLASHRGM